MQGSKGRAAHSSQNAERLKRLVGQFCRRRCSCVKSTRATRQERSAVIQMIVCKRREPRSRSKDVSRARTCARRCDPSKQRRVSGPGPQPMVFAHGFGCDQHMWRFVVPAFEDAYKRGAVRSRRRRPVGPLRVRRAEVRALSTATPTTCSRSAGELHLSGRRLCRPFVSRDDRRARREPGPAAVRERSSWSGLRHATSTTTAMSAGSRGRTSKACSMRSTAIISAGRARWRRRSWATPIGRNSAQELTNSFCRTDPEIAARFRPGDVPLRQPGTTSHASDANADPAVRRGCHRAVLRSATTFIARSPGAGW